ncbi:unnamed protein product, partial [marine sediment metagenome]
MLSEVRIKYTDIAEGLKNMPHLILKRAGSKD